MQTLLTLSRWLARYTSSFIILVAVAAFFVPNAFGWVQEGQRASVILGLIMLTMGCTLSTEDFRILLSRPLDILIGAVAQYTIMPLVAWALAQVFHLDNFMTAGIVLVGCCPGGVSSNIMSFLCKGDVAYSVGMTTVSTVLSPFVTPLLVLWLAGAEIEVDALGMFKNILLVTLLPVTLGVGFNYLFRGKRYFKQLQGVMPGVSVLCLACIVGGVIFTVHPQLEENGVRLILLTLAVVTLHNGTGYLLGYIVGSAFGMNKAKCRTLSIEVGMQNAGMATVLARNFFASPAMIAMNPMAALAVFPCAISCAYHSISGTLLAGFFNRRKTPSDSPIKGEKQSLDEVNPLPLREGRGGSVFLLLLLLFASTLTANDGVYYTSGSFLVPLRETDISVKNEVLEITLQADSFASVTVDYTFFNHSKAKSVTMAFEASAPYNAWVPVRHDSGHPFIEDFTVTFNGKPLRYSNALVAGPMPDPSAENPGNRTNDFTPLDPKKWKGFGEVADTLLPMDHLLVNPELPDSFLSYAYAYFFDAPFQKGENHVRHTYRYRMSYGVGRDYELTYWLTPITRWQGGKADEFTMRIRSEVNREIILSDSIFLGAPFTLKGFGETYQLQSDYWGFSQCLFAPLTPENVLEWHTTDFAPTKNLQILPLYLLKGGVRGMSNQGRVVVRPDGYEARYIADSGDNYFIEAQDYALIPKEGARVEMREATKGQGYVYLKDYISKANVRQKPSLKSKVLFTIDNDDELPEGYRCLDFVSHLEADGLYKWWYKVEINGKVGYISEDITVWDSIQL